MAKLRALLMRMRGMFGGSRAEAAIGAELESHLAMHIEDNVRAGMTPAEARRQALIRLGGMEQTRQAWRDRRTLPWLETLGQDVRFGFRMLRKSPGFAAIAILTLALGIGANTAIFSVVNAVLLRPLPYAHPSRVVLVSEADPKAGFSGAGMSWPAFSELRDHNRSFNAVAGLAGHALTLTGQGEPADMSTVVVTQDFFTVFGTKPLLGRTLLPGDGQPGAAPAVVLSEDLWRNRFGADPGIVGRSITLDQRSFTVVGVMPASFRSPFFSQADQVWIPLIQDPLFSGWMSHPQAPHWMPVVGLLRPGVSTARARAEMKTISAGLAAKFPEEHGWEIGIEPLREAVVGDVRSPLLVLLCAVALVLLIACANIANLLLTRATARSTEIAVRVAVGASPRRIARQLLTESAILGLLGGAAGVGLAWWGVSALEWTLPAGLPRYHSIRVDGSVLLFALALSLAASLAFGLVPALFSAKGDPQNQLLESARSGEGRGSQRARSLLATAEVALAMVLLVAAGLLMRSFIRLTSVRPGFALDHLAKAEVSLPRFQYSKPEQWVAFSNQLMTRLQAQPGLQDSAIAAPLPILDTSVSLPFAIHGNPPLPPGAVNLADYAAVTPHYFHVMEIPLLRGRLFDADDSMSTLPVALISQAFARRYFPGQDPVGRRMMFGFPPNGHVSREIVGVVGDIHDVSLAKMPGPMMYVPFAQAPFWGGEVVVRSALSTSAVAGAIRAETHSIDRNLPVTDIESFPEAVDASVAQPRFRTALLEIFGGMALLLAAVGIFGVVSWSVSRRTREIGVRMALGARRQDVVRLVLMQGVRPALVGVGVGAVAALLLTRLMDSLLYGIRATDAPTYAGVAILLLAVEMVATYIPARRAASVNPMEALRAE